MWFENQKIMIIYALDKYTDMHVEKLAEIDTMASRTNLSKWVHGRAKNGSFGPWMVGPPWMS